MFRSWREKNAFVVLIVTPTGIPRFWQISWRGECFPKNGDYAFGELFLKVQYGKRLPLSVFSRLELIIE
jgi:hypothetical protein